MDRLIGVVISEEQKKPPPASPALHQTQPTFDFEFDHLSFGDLPCDDAPLSPKLIVPEYRTSHQSLSTSSTNPNPKYNTDSRNHNLCPEEQDASAHPQSVPDDMSPTLVRDISLSSSHYPANSVMQLLAEEMGNKKAWSTYDDFYIPVVKRASEEKGDTLSKILVSLVPASMVQKFHGVDESSAGTKARGMKDNKWAFKGLLKKVVPRSYMYGAREKQRVEAWSHHERRQQQPQQEIRSAPITPRMTTMTMALQS